MSDFYLNMPKLGAEHAVAAIINQYYDRELQHHKTAIVDSSKSNDLRDFTADVCLFISKLENSIYNEYRDAIIIALSGDVNHKKDIEKANKIMWNTLRDQYLNAWFRSNK